MTDPRCGTYAGWNVHRRKGETQCDACQQAKNTYQRAYDRAKSALRDRHLAEFDQLLSYFLDDPDRATAPTGG